MDSGSVPGRRFSTWTAVQCLDSGSVPGQLPAPFHILKASLIRPLLCLLRPMLALEGVPVATPKSSLENSPLLCVPDTVA